MNDLGDSGKYTLFQRRKIYKRALLIYKLSRIPVINWFILSTCSGLCHYLFTCKIHMSDLPELNKHKPEKYKCYWFPPGELKPRIAILKLAIADCDKQMEAGFREFLKENNH